MWLLGNILFIPFLLWVWVFGDVGWRVFMQYPLIIVGSVGFLLSITGQLQPTKKSFRAYCGLLVILFLWQTYTGIYSGIYQAISYRETREIWDKQNRATTTVVIYGAMLNGRLSNASLQDIPCMVNRVDECMSDASRISNCLTNGDMRQTLTDRCETGHIQ
jgi:hypothetical protein